MTEYLDGVLDEWRHWTTAASLRRYGLREANFQQKVWRFGMALRGACVRSGKAFLDELTE
jgi:hypothetical protein